MFTILEEPQIVMLLESQERSMKSRVYRPSKADYMRDYMRRTKARRLRAQVEAARKRRAEILERRAQGRELRAKRAERIAQEKLGAAIVKAMIQERRAAEKAARDLRDRERQAKRLEKARLRAVERSKKKVNRVS